MQNKTAREANTKSSSNGNFSSNTADSSTQQNIFYHPVAIVVVYKRILSFKWGESLLNNISERGGYTSHTYVHVVEKVADAVPAHLKKNRIGFLSWFDYKR